MRYFITKFRQACVKIYLCRVFIYLFKENRQEKSLQNTNDDNVYTNYLKTKKLIINIVSEISIHKCTLKVCDTHTLYSIHTPEDAYPFSFVVESKIIMYLNLIWPKLFNTYSRYNKYIYKTKL